MVLAKHVWSVNPANSMKYPKPIKPLVLTQPWGVYRPDVYSQFGFNRHNGIDVAKVPNKLISCPINGIVVRVGNQPNGGGIFVSICDGANLWDFLHCESIIVQEGQKVEVGQPLAYQDNTGLSTGPHTHIQVRPVDNWDGFKQWNYIMKNDANNSADPLTLFTEDYAEDIWALKQKKSILEKLISLYKQLYERTTKK